MKRTKTRFLSTTIAGSKPGYMPDFVPVVQPVLVVSLTETGVSDFGKLQSDLKNGDHSSIVYCAFDVMFLDGFDLTDAPLIE
jgi:bifunctional non-homologous end joining protein LigD